MKKIVYFSGILGFALLSMNASAKNTHNNENKSFRHAFHHAKNVHRFDKANGNVEYDFMMKGKYVAAFYDQSGSLIETDFSIAYKELPAAAQRFLNAKFSNAVITDMTKVTHKQNYFYKIKFEVDNAEYSVVVSPSGEITMGY